ncbi:hypothetical protein QTO34_012130, partial [Cnephaeus nilssonii]
MVSTTPNTLPGTVGLSGGNTVTLQGEEQPAGPVEGAVGAPGGAGRNGDAGRWARAGATPGLEAALQKLALRRKKVLSAEEMELYELAQAAGGAMDPDVFKILVDLLKLNVAPLAVFQMLKSMCAGQRLASEPQDPAAGSLPTSSRPPFSLPRTVAPLQGPPFPQPRGLRPLRFCTTAQLPRTRLSLQGPPVPSGTLAACSLLLQVAFIGLSLGVVVLSCFHGNCCGPRKPEQLLAARAGSCWPSLPRSLETKDTISWFIKRQPAVPLTPQRLTLLGETCALQRCPCPRGEEDEGQGGCYRRPNSAWPGLGGAMASELGTSMLGDAAGEKQKQHCSWGRPHPGRTKLPGRIQPEDAPTAQCDQAAQGGGAWEEPHSEQYLSQANH